MVIPKWLSSYLKLADLGALEAHVQDIEKRTSAEIVTVVVRSSSQYRQSQVTLALLGILAFLFFWELLGTSFYWDHLTVSLLLVALGLVMVFLGIPQLSKIGFVQRLMTVRSEELEQSWKRAKIEFYENCVDRTKERTGVLIFISVLEKSVIILADQTISQKLPSDTWQKAVDGLILGLKNKDLAQGIKMALNECSSLLIENFPVKLDDKNELPNPIIIKE